MRLWIDLSNSPHALLFAPVARRLEELGHTVFVTARDNAQTVALARGYWPEVEVVGDESPPGRVAKTRVLVGRIEALRRIARRERPDAALSHNSYAQIVAAKLAGIRSVTAMDYEFQPLNHLAFRLADTVLLPEAMRSANPARQGARDRKTRYYPGFKEEIYVGDFRPDDGVLDALGIGETGGRSLVVIRTPPSRAVYHRFGNALFDAAVRTLGSDPAVLCVVLPRHREQLRELTSLGLPSLFVAPSAVDARSLMYRADLVIGAGGTMTREAALLGTPTVSIFAGTPPAVDRELVARGLLRRAEDIETILPVVPRPSPPIALSTLRQRSAVLVEWLLPHVTGG